MRARNFLISYSGRVGSTALIDTLKLLPNIVVPVFEEFDFWWLEANGRLNEFNHDNIHCAVGSVFHDRKHKHETAGLSVGLKWRIWGDLSALASVLKGSDVVVFNLVRSDVVEFISSLYISDIVFKEFNAPQFMLADANDDNEKQKLLFRYRVQQQHVDLTKYFDLYTRKIEEERARLKALQALSAHGLEVVTILYEDFAYKRFHFLCNFLEAINQPRPKTLPLTRLSKVSSPFPSELFRNREELFASPRLASMVSEWDDLIYNSGFMLV